MLKYMTMSSQQHLPGSSRRLAVWRSGRSWRRGSLRRWRLGFDDRLSPASRLVVVVVAAAGWLLLGPARPVAAATSDGTFQPPLPPPLTVTGAFSLPAQPWLAGNRGVDLAASTGEPVLAAASGVVVYAGELAGRGVISISHGTLRTTYEPVDPVVHAGDIVGQGDVIGHVSAVADGCGAPGQCLHWGARTGGSYVDPMSLLGTTPVRLLPIWGGGLPPDALPAQPRAQARQTAAMAAGQADATGLATAGILGAGARKEPAGPAETATPTTSSDRRPGGVGIAATATATATATAGVVVLAAGGLAGGRHGITRLRRATQSLQL